MIMKKHPIAIGVEEEFFIVDRQSGDLIEDPCVKIFEECDNASVCKVKREFLQCQIETNTNVCSSIQKLKDELSQGRVSINKVLGEYDYALMAAGTHPSGLACQQKVVQDKYHQQLKNVIKGEPNRFLACGMHVHIETSLEYKVGLLNRIRGFLPLILSLSTSSPFFQGMPMGEMSYRSSLCKIVKNSSVPRRFINDKDYEFYIDKLIKENKLASRNNIYWPIRCSTHYPTMELRIADVCTSIQDAITICSVYLCLVNILIHCDANHLSFYSNNLHEINKQVHLASSQNITDGLLLNIRDGGKVTFKQCCYELLEFIDDVAKQLNCSQEVYNILKIVETGTSADKQLKVYKENNNFSEVLSYLIKQSGNASEK